MRGEQRCEGPWIPNPDAPYQVAETLRMIRVGAAHSATTGTGRVRV
jgi:hypothetical protein